MATGVAFAGTTIVNLGAANMVGTVALEAMGAARNVTFAGAANGPIAYTVTQNITSANFVSVALSGAAFTGDTFRICKQDTDAAGNQRAVGTPSAGATAFNFQLAAAAADIAAGQILYLTTDAACNTTGAAANFIVQASTTTVPTNPSISISIVSAGNIPVDPNSTATLLKIDREYAVANTSAANSHVVDYLGSVGTGVNFTVTPTGATNSTAASDNIVAFNRTVKNFGAANGTLAGAGLTISGFVTLSDSLAWSGVSKVFINTAAPGGSSCADAAASNNVGVASPTGAVSLAIPAAAYNGIGLYGTLATATVNNVPVNVCIVGNGTTALAPRTITIAGAVNATGVTGATSAASTCDVWTLNAYQTWVPWMVNATGAPTYCLINNADGTRTASVLLDVITGENSIVINNKTLGSIAAKTSNMATFTANSAALTNGTAVDLTTIGANARYSAKLTVTANPSNVSVQCIQTDPVTGGKRTVNTLQNPGTWTF